MDDFKSIIGKVATGATLSRDEAASAFDSMMSGEATPSQMGGLLMALRVRGETVDEITGAVSAMRAKMLRVVKIDITPEQVGHCVAKAGIGFMFAPTHHPATKNVGPTRTELGTRTIFNLLGPLSNPAGVRRQMVGVFSRQWVLPLAQVLKNLGAESAWVVHGSDGLDEITLTGPTFVAALENGEIRTFEVTPEQAGLPRASGEALKGGDAAANAIALQSVLDGKPGPYRDVALLNAAAALIVAGRAKDLTEGVGLGTKSLDSGAAAARLKQLIAVSNG